MVDRDPRETRLVEDPDRLLEGHGVLHQDHVDPRRHDLAGGGIAELEHRVEHVLLALLDRTFLLTDIDPFLDLLFRDRGLRYLLADAKCRAHPFHEPDDGGEDPGEEEDDGGNGEGKRVRCPGSIDLRARSRQRPGAR